MVLKNTWDFHAFPEAESGKEAYRMDDSASLERERIRKEIYIEQTTDYRMRRHTVDDDRTPAGRRAAKTGKLDDLMLLAVGSPAYVEAYNYQVSFTLNGVETEMTQGWLYDFAKRHREDLRNQIDAGRRKGIGIDELAILQTQHDAYQTIEVNADPQRGKMTPDRWQKIQTVFDENENISNRARQEHSVMSGPENSAVNSIERQENNPVSNSVVSALSQQDSRTSFAGQLDDAESQELTAAFQVAAIGLPAGPQSAPDAPLPAKGTGLGL